MLRIAIADDEERIRLGLAKMIRAASPEYYVEGVYANGAELLRHVEEHATDLVITDIRMPIMNGLEFAEQLHRNYEQVKCIIISGYNDFDYARAALRYKVSDYLLKPVDKAELYRLLQNVDAVINGEKEKDKEERRRLLEHITTGPDSTVIPLQLKGHAVWYAIRSERPIEIEQIEAVLYAEEIPNEGAIRLTNEFYGVLVHLEQTHSVGTESESIGTRLLTGISAHAAVSIGISIPFADGSQIRAAFTEAAGAARKAMYRFEHIALVHAAAGRGDKSASMLEAWFKEWEQAYIRSLQIVDVGQLEQEITELFRAFHREQEPYESVLEMLDRVFYLTKREIREFAELAENAFGSGTLWKEKMGAYYKFEPMARFFTDNFLRVLGEIRDRRSGSVRAVEEVKALIDKSYKDELDLGKLAAQVFLTPSYLSKLFKQETGVTITDYAIKVRIEEAKQLLKSRHDLKTYEVGERVGYPDSAYFAKIFKKVVGITPNEYRQVVR